MACNNYIDQTDDICKKVSVIKYPVDILRTPEEEVLAECCSSADFGAGSQEYCNKLDAPAYCSGKTCVCQSNPANPSIGQIYGVTQSSDCYATEKYYEGKCWYATPAVVIGWDYNQALEPEHGVNVYVREEKVWFIDPKGYLIPASLTITVW